jgi:hypothetical protein
MAYQLSTEYRLPLKEYFTFYKHQSAKPDVLECHCPPNIQPQGLTDMDLLTVVVDTAGVLVTCYVLCYVKHWVSY